MKSIQGLCIALTSAFLLWGCSDAEETTAGRPGKMDAPTLSVVDSSATSISINVLAGATGAPAGFSFQWMEESQFTLTGWLASDDPGLCKASFSGNAQNSRFNLGPGESTVVEVGNLFDEEPGVSFNCDELKCGTTYVFRAFAHATSTLMRSDFTPNLTATTLPCTPQGGCTLTQGYWKTHPEAWPVDTLQLGSTSYTQEQLLSILNTPAQGNGLLSLSHQLIAAKLNVAKGADPTALGTAIADADALIDGLVIPPVGSGFLAPSSTSALTSTLDDYNNGTTGPGHCQ